MILFQKWIFVTSEKMNVKKIKIHISDKIQVKESVINKFSNQYPEGINIQIYMITNEYKNNLKKLIRGRFLLIIVSYFYIFFD